MEKIIYYWLFSILFYIGYGSTTGSLKPFPEEGTSSEKIWYICDVTIFPILTVPIILGKELGELSLEHEKEGGS